MAAIGRQESDVDAMLTALRSAREEYEREVVGVRANLWNGLINRFNSDLTVARHFHIEQQRETPVAEEPTTNDHVLKELQAMRSDFAQLVPVLAGLASAIKSIAPASPPIAEPKPTPSPEPQPMPVPLPAPVIVAAPVASTTPVLEKPGVGIGVLGGVATLVLQALGVLGPSTGADATTAGSLLPAVSAGIAALGATGMLGSWGGALGSVFSLLTKGLQQQNVQQQSPQK